MEKGGSKTRDLLLSCLCWCMPVAPSPLDALEPMSRGQSGRYSKNWSQRGRRGKGGMDRGGEIQQRAVINDLNWEWRDGSVVKVACTAPTVDSGCALKPLVSAGRHLHACIQTYMYT